MADLGYTFTPGLANRFRSAVNGQAPQLGANATQALQVLSLHLPDVIGGHSPAPDALLRGGTGIRPDMAVRAQTSGQPATQSPLTASTPPASTPAANASPLSTISPTFSSAASAPPSINSGAPNPFTSGAAMDSGPTSSMQAAGSPAFKFRQDDPNGGGPTAGPSTAPNPEALTSFLQAIFGNNGFGGGGGQDFQTPSNY